MWRFKTDCKGEKTTAVERRLTMCEVYLTSAESRSEFGYCYLEYVKEDLL